MVCVAGCTPPTMCHAKRWRVTAKAHGRFERYRHTTSTRPTLEAHARTPPRPRRDQECATNRPAQMPKLRCANWDGLAHLAGTCHKIDQCGASGANSLRRIVAAAPAQPFVARAREWLHGDRRTAACHTCHNTRWSGARRPHALALRTHRAGHDTTPRTHQPSLKSARRLQKLC